jgi:mannose-1-phosphate guanylyltransferase / mannose-6-phosphate isomerase
MARTADHVIQPVILAGGSGTRLWPASRQSHPKQLLALAGHHTMLQETALRLEGFAEASLADSALLTTNAEYRFMIADQLNAVGKESARIVLEPVGRNTAPALTVAALLTTEAADPVLLVMPSDHLIADVPAFHRVVAEGARLASTGKIVAFGVPPTHPETGYGYIRVGEALRGTPTARELVGFVEKPDSKTAQEYLKRGGYLWNSGMFMVTRSVWLASIERWRPDIAAASRAAVASARTDGRFIHLDKAAFAACPSESIDYAVMEHIGRQSSELEGAVVPLDAGWSDVGAWEAVWATSPKDEQGNVVRGNVVLEDTRNTLVQAESRLVAVLGVDDIVIAETTDAVLVARKDATADLKRMVDRLRELDERVTLEHRRVHRPWGWYQSIDEGPRFQVKRLMVAPGARMSLQYHQRRAEHWVVVRGVAEVTCDGRVFRLEENASTYVPTGAAHRLANPGPEPLEIIEVQSGDYLGEDDIVRLEDTYGRVTD